MMVSKTEMKQCGSCGGGIEASFAPHVVVHVGPFTAAFCDMDCRDEYVRRVTRFVNVKEA